MFQHQGGNVIFSKKARSTPRGSGLTTEQQGWLMLYTRSNTSGCCQRSSWNPIPPMDVHFPEWEGSAGLA